ncbi:radial spoke head 14 homolog [Ictalurus punctatus]|uniref:Radial spoke head 14 homolog n=1 Tax=Ictalurus punctatus TaxID=7998 RepID=A0A2D0QZR9_ICTPU|nr:radial spoke head 14 homolog [Ictalurus punctatus]XP_017323019.1 radial spoke head 14 homolog [Ictalurus punctatus]XP_017323020.1 radial spoke head 14 homolog [Ictalurus punctatus]
MAGTVISERLPPLIDPSRIPVAFGNRAVPRLMSELQDEEPKIRQGALCSLCDLLHDPERAYEALHHGCLERLKVLLKDDDGLLRTKTCEALYQLVTHSVGREAVLQCDALGPLSELLDEPEDACRETVHQVLKMMSEFPAGVVRMMSLGLVPRLVMKVPVESEDIRELVLSTLSRCMRLDALPALASDALPVLKEQLNHPSTHIRRAASAGAMAISVPAEGKVRVCEEEVIPVLVKLLSDDDTEVRANAAGALMYTAVITRGKYQALEAGAVPPLLRLVDSEDVASCANALRALTCLAEAPSGRARLIHNLPQLEARLSHPASIIQKAAATAIQVISWTP